MTTPQHLSTESYQRLNAMVSQVQSRFIRAAPTTDVFSPLLTDLLSFTDSEYGFIADVLIDPNDGHRFVRMQVLTDISWNEETRLMYQAHHGGERAMEFHNLNSLLGAAVVSGAPVIANDPAHDARRGGLPHHHPPLNCYLGVPLFHGGELVGMVGLSNRPGGYDGDLLDFLQPLFASVGAIIGAVHSDAARLHAETALRQSELEMRSTFEMAAVGMAHLGIDGRFLRVNRQLCISLACAEAALLGRAIFDVIRADDGRLLIGHMAVLINGSAPRVTQELRGIHPSGQELWLLFSATLVPQAVGKVAFVIAVLEDITARKQNASRLLAAEAAERANAAKTRFLSHISHELRTPLNAVVGFSQLLQIDKKQPLTDAQRVQVHHIETAGSHLLAMINDVLDLSRIESGMMALSLEAINLHQVAQEAASMLKQAAAEAGVNIDIRLPVDASDACAWADRLRLRQVLVNLLSNAIKYNRRGGWVSLVTQPGECPGTIELRVHDTGSGLTAGQREHLFEPFNRLGAEHSRIEGTGIGLLISRSLLELMGGSIEVSSEVQVGSCFTVVLKAATSLHQPDAVAPPRPIAIEPLPVAPGSFVLLYAEDNPMNVELLEGVLMLRPQWRMVSASSGQAAIAAASAQPLDLLLIDMHLGDMTGLALLQQLRRDPLLAPLPCLILSADAMQTSQAQAAQAGVNAYLTKPLDVPSFLRMLDTVAAR